MRSVLWASVIAVTACGGGDSPGSVSGSVHGSGIAIGDVVSASVAGKGTTLGQHFAFIEMSTTGNLCADATDPVTEHPDQEAVLIEMFDVNGTTFNTPTVPGTYAIYQGTGAAPPKSALLSVKEVDVNCKDIATSAAKATTGTITLTGVSGNVFSGTFDVALDSGDHLTGSFSPEECPALQTIIDSTAATPTCK